MDAARIWKLAGQFKFHTCFEEALVPKEVSSLAPYVNPAARPGKITGDHPYVTAVSQLTQYSVHETVVNLQ
jgi:hypothetical protein